ncbi:MAG: hypothetical protein V7678_04385 [Brevundimonas sp.]
MAGLAAFENPQKLIDRAISARREADSAAKVFFKADSFRRIREYERGTGYTIEKLRMVRTFPDTIEERLTDAINNTRNAFDQIIFAACDAIRKPTKDGHFPWACSRTDLDDWRLQNKKTGKETVPREFWDVIRAHQPYPRNDANTEGDTFIRTMAMFANRKHTIGIEVGCNVSETTIGCVHFDRVAAGIIPMPRWDPKRKEIELGRWRGQAYLGGKSEVSFYVAFDSSAPDELTRYAAPDAVGLFAEKAQMVLNDIKDTAKALGVR